MHPMDGLRDFFFFNLFKLKIVKPFFYGSLVVLILYCNVFDPLRDKFLNHE